VIAAKNIGRTIVALLETGLVPSGLRPKLVRTAAGAKGKPKAPPNTPCKHCGTLYSKRGVANHERSCNKAPAATATAASAGEASKAKAPRDTPCRHCGILYSKGGVANHERSCKKAPAPAAAAAAAADAGLTDAGALGGEPESKRLAIEGDVSSEHKPAGVPTATEQPPIKTNKIAARDTRCPRCGKSFTASGFGKHPRNCSVVQPMDTSADRERDLAGEGGAGPAKEVVQADAPGEPERKRPARAESSSEDKPAQASSEASSEESKLAARCHSQLSQPSAATAPWLHGIDAILLSDTEASPEQEAPKASLHHSFEVIYRT
jgi:hypothetical protein